MTVVSGFYVGPGPNVTITHLEMGFYSLWKRGFKLTIFIVVVCVQPADPLQREVLIGGKVNILKDASMQPGCGGTEAEQRRKRPADSLFLSKDSGEK